MRLNSQFSSLVLCCTQPFSTVEIKKLILFGFIVHWCMVVFLDDRSFVRLYPRGFLKDLFVLYGVSMFLIDFKFVLFADNLNKHVLLIQVWSLGLIYLSWHELLLICFWNRSDQIDYFVILFWNKFTNFLSALVMVNIIQQKLPSLNVCGGLFCGKWLWNYCIFTLNGNVVLKSANSWRFINSKFTFALRDSICE